MYRESFNDIHSSLSGQIVRSVWHRVPPKSYGKVVQKRDARVIQECKRSFVEMPKLAALTIGAIAGAIGDQRTGKQHEAHRKERKAEEQRHAQKRQKKFQRQVRLPRVESSDYCARQHPGAAKVGRSSLQLRPSYKTPMATAALVDKATNSEFLSQPDWSVNSEIIDVLNGVPELYVEW